MVARKVKSGTATPGFSATWIFACATFELGVDEKSGKAKAINVDLI
jgi:hypothetical protein